jgi:hypothetical protein
MSLICLAAIYLLGNFHSRSTTNFRFEIKVFVTPVNCLERGRSHEYHIKCRPYITVNQTVMSLSKFRRYSSQYYRITDT